MSEPGRKQASKISLTQRSLGFGNRVRRAFWTLVWTLFFRPTPAAGFFWWRRFLLRCFGARIGSHSFVYPSTRIWAPWNLEMGDHSSLGHDVDCYSVDNVRIGDRVTVSQYAYLCTASHDFEAPGMPLVTGPITLGDDSWICAGAFVGPGVAVGPGAVAGARSAVFRNVDPWTVVGGNPAKVIRPRRRPSTEAQRA